MIQIHIKQNKQIYENKDRIKMNNNKTYNNIFMRRNFEIHQQETSIKSIKHC